MKAEQLNRFMRVNGRKNLWMLRNTNQIYESAVKTYYDRNNSVLPYKPMPMEIKRREENCGPVRALATHCKNSNESDYPTNHQQMTERASRANSAILLNTVMQANRRRSMSFTASSLPSYVYSNSSSNVNSTSSSCNTSCTTNNHKNSSSISSSNKNVIGRERLRRQRLTPAPPVSADDPDMSIWSGRSMSLPPRTTLELGLSMGYAMDREKAPPSQKHHINAMEKSSTAAATELARRKGRLPSAVGRSSGGGDRMSTGRDADLEQLMIVDGDLKRRLAVRFDRPDSDDAYAARLRLGQLAATQLSKSSSDMEQTRFQTLGERIRRFGAIQFADGPVTHQAFNRRPGYGSGRIQQAGGAGGLSGGGGGVAGSGSKHLPKQQPCLSFRNVLHTNHRQRSLNLNTRHDAGELDVAAMATATATATAAIPHAKAKAQAQAQAKAKALPMPLGPLETLTLNRRPQQQQQQQQQQPPPPTTTMASSQFIRDLVNQAAPANRVQASRSRRSVKQAADASQRTARDRGRQQQQQQQAEAQPLQQQSWDSMRAVMTNPLSRSSHLSYTQGAESANRNAGANGDGDGGMGALPAAVRLRSNRLAEELGGERKAKPLRKLREDLPKQPHAVKGAHHLLAASASQVSAFRRAFKNRQQIQQAELMHNHVQNHTLPAQQERRLHRQQEREQQQQRHRQQEREQQQLQLQQQQQQQQQQQY
ncbi:hypothetical protein KR222_000273, partial [Zaprionus bogoriensis]